MRINIVGWYGEQNVGDESFRQVFIERLSGHDLIFSQSVDPTADRIIFGGGGVMGFHYLDNLPTGVDAFGMGVDIPLNGDQWNRMRGYKFKEILCRSKEYSYLAYKQGAEVHYCPDLAFAMKMSNAPNFKRKGPQIGVILTNELCGKLNLIEHIVGALSELQSVGDLVFIPMFESLDGKVVSDREVHQLIADQLPKATHLIQFQPDPVGVLKTISQMDLLISMRFHGIIFSTMANIPFVSLANKGKHSIFCEQEKLKDLFVELPDISDYKLKEAALDVLGDASVPGRLKEIAVRNKTDVMLAFDRVRRFWLS